MIAACKAAAGKNGNAHFVLSGLFLLGGDSLALPISLVHNKPAHRMSERKYFRKMKKRY
jgi:hypothetical protein